MFSISQIPWYWATAAVAGLLTLISFLLDRRIERMAVYDPELAAEKRIGNPHMPATIWGTTSMGAFSTLLFAMYPDMLEVRKEAPATAWLLPVTLLFFAWFLYMLYQRIRLAMAAG